MLDLNETPSAARPVHTLLSECHLAGAPASRCEAAHLTGVQNDVKVLPETTLLNARLSVGLVKPPSANFSP